MVPLRTRKHTAYTNKMRWVLAIAILGATWLTPAQSWAQASDPAAARTLFQEARKAADLGDYTTACPKFADSYHLDPAIGTLLNIADCEQRLGRIANAWVIFQKALEQLPMNDDRRSQVEKAALSLEKRLPRLSIRLAVTAPKESTVERDGMPVAISSLGIALPVDPGQHVVIAKAPGHHEQRYEVNLNEGQSRELLCEPEPADTPSVPSSSTQRDSPAQKPEAAKTAHILATEKLTSASRPISSGNAPLTTKQLGPRSQSAGQIVGSVGVLGLVAGIVTRVLAFSQKLTIDAHCDVSKACDSTGMNAVSRANKFQTVSTVSLLVGLAGVGTGIYLIVAGSKEPTTQETLHPLVLSGGAGLSLQRNF